jgi:hypothetical protein
MASIKVKGESKKLKGLCLLLCALCFQHVKAQSFSFSDLFGQGGKNIRNMQAQIAALIALENSTRQCYNMLHSEWSAIGNFKNGEFTLHQGYYTSLNQVNPQVKSSTDINSVQGEQQSIVSQFKAISSLSGLSPGEQAYVKTAQQNLLADLNKNLDDLSAVLADGKLAMSDDERIRRVRQLTAAIKEEYLFTCHFCGQVRLLAITRNQDANDAQTLNNLYGNH